MGGGFAGLASRQHPDLTRAAGDDANLSPASRRALRNVVLLLLAVDGIISAIVAALLLPSHIGSVPFPISSLISGLVNAGLVWAGLQWTTSWRLAAIPLWTWLLTVGVLSLGGPGGDIVFGGSGVMGYAVLILLVLGALPPAWLLWRRRSAAS
jgi:hypothetical protein